MFSSYEDLLCQEPIVSAHEFDIKGFVPLPEGKFFSLDTQGNMTIWEKHGETFWSLRARDAAHIKAQYEFVKCESPAPKQYLVEDVQLWMNAGTRPDIYYVNELNSRCLISVGNAGRNRGITDTAVIIWNTETRKKEFCCILPNARCAFWFDGHLICGTTKGEIYFFKQNLVAPELTQVMEETKSPPNSQTFFQPPAPELPTDIQNPQPSAPVIDPDEVMPPAIAEPGKFSPDVASFRLMAAVKRGSAEEIDYWLTEGADVNYVEQKTNMTALLYAIKLGRMDCLQCLLQCPEINIYPKIFLEWTLFMQRKFDKNILDFVLTAMDFMVLPEPFDSLRRDPDQVNAASLDTSALEQKIEDSQYTGLEYAIALGENCLIANFLEHHRDKIFVQNKKQISLTPLAVAAIQLSTKLGRQKILELFIEALKLKCKSESGKANDAAILKQLCSILSPLNLHRYAAIGGKNVWDYLKTLGVIPHDLTTNKKHRNLFYECLLFAIQHGTASEIFSDEDITKFIVDNESLLPRIKHVINVAIEYGCCHVLTILLPLWDSKFTYSPFTLKPEKEYELEGIQEYHRRYSLSPMWQNSVLIYALHSGQITMAKSIFEEYKQKASVTDLAEIACMASIWGHYDFVEYLIQQKIPLEDTSLSISHSSLISAIRGGHSGIVLLLLKQNCDLNIRDINEFDALSWATTNEEIFKRLCPIIPNKLIEPNSDGWCPISIAAINGNLNVLRYIANYINLATVKFKNEISLLSLAIASLQRKSLSPKNHPQFFTQNRLSLIFGYHFIPKGSGNVLDTIKYLIQDAKIPVTDLDQQLAANNPELMEILTPQPAFAPQ